MKQLKLYISILTIIGVLGCWIGCDKGWDDHYGVSDTEVYGSSLWKTITSNDELSDFAAILKENGYDEVLAASQSYTVWAPTNTALTYFEMADSLILKEFIKNHIARYSNSASGSFSKNVTMLNSKVLTFMSDNGRYYIEDIPLLTKNIQSKNGIVHILGEPIEFFYNIWEYLPKNTTIDSLTNYLLSYNETVFDAESSTAGDVDENGNTIYLDSVFVDSNEKFDELGMLNDEDSSYIMICPTNEAWNQTYAKIALYYNFFSYDSIEADTLKRNNTLLALTNDLVFSETMQGSTSDSLVSTQHHVFHNPYSLLKGAQEVEASNGKVYIVDSLQIRPWEAWHEEIVVEAETLNGRESTFSSTYTRNTYGSMVSGISNDKYIDIIPSNAASNPTVTFKIPNTLSAAYKIYCVFVPETVENSSAKNLMPNKVTFQLTYLNKGGTQKTQRFASDDFVTTSDALCKMIVTDNFTFPTANFGQDDVNVKLKVLSNVSQNETTTYTREMRIDCIILEPVH